eukprot:TRINITY_DN22144_c0_g1_i1.p1 TRINITY_DN22144_c0_g1~~TRINITY_DN22144_c0_g1_i1.p1  ORF type:complete len:326 (-),score=50.81 TRINITY_DN22144_c0_g1_i1:319-1242(-)
MTTSFEIIDALGRALSAAISPDTSDSVLVNCQGDAFLKAFCASEQTPLGITCYLKRIHKNFACSDECFVIAAAYLDRALVAHPGLSFNCFNVHRLLLTSVVLAVKFHDDMRDTNSWYAKVGGVSVEELNRLEVSLLRLLAWRVNVGEREFSCHLCLLLSPNPCISASAANRAEAIGHPCEQAAEIAETKGHAGDERGRETQPTGLACARAGEDKAEAVVDLSPRTECSTVSGFSDSSSDEADSSIGALVEEKVMHGMPVKKLDATLLQPRRRIFLWKFPLIWRHRSGDVQRCGAFWRPTLRSRVPVC